MNKTAKACLLIGASGFAFIYAFTSPIIQIYFMKLVDARLLALANMISMLLAAIINSTIPIDRFKTFYRKYFIVLNIIDVTCFIVISLLSVDHVVIRFIGFAIINSITTNICISIMRDTINHIISGDSLTNWTAIVESSKLWAAFAGGIVAMIFVDLDVNLCIALQCIWIFVDSITYILAYRILSHDMAVVELDQKLKI